MYALPVDVMSDVLLLLKVEDIISFYMSHYTSHEKYVNARVLLNKLIVLLELPNKVDSFKDLVHLYDIEYGTNASLKYQSRKMCFFNAVKRGNCAMVTKLHPMLFVGNIDMNNRWRREFLKDCAVNVARYERRGLSVVLSDIWKGDSDLRSRMFAASAISKSDFCLDNPSFTAVRTDCLNGLWLMMVEDANVKEISSPASPIQIKTNLCVIDHVFRVGRLDLIKSSISGIDRLHHCAHIAARERHLDILDYMFNSGIGVDLNDSLEVVKDGMGNVFKFIVDKMGSEHKKTTFKEALITAVEFDHLDVAEYIRSLFPEIDITDHIGVAAKDSPKVLRYILTLNPSVDQLRRALNVAEMADNPTLIRIINRHVEKFWMFIK